MVVSATHSPTVNCMMGKDGNMVVLTTLPSDWSAASVVTLNIFCKSSKTWRRRHENSQHVGRFTSSLWQFPFSWSSGSGLYYWSTTPHIKYSKSALFSPGCWTRRRWRPPAAPPLSPPPSDRCCSSCSCTAAWSGSGCSHRGTRRTTAPLCCSAPETSG